MSDPVTPELYVVELTAEELETVRIVHGRKPAARRKPTPRAKVGAPRLFVLGKPPKLTPGQRTRLEGEWECAIAEPAAWHVGLAGSKARPMGYRDADAVAKAWGLPPVQARLIAERAARS